MFSVWINFDKNVTGDKGERERSNISQLTNVLALTHADHVV